MLVAMGLGSPLEHALTSLLALNGLRVSEANGADIEHLCGRSANSLRCRSRNSAPVLGAGSAVAAFASSMLRVIGGAGHPGHRTRRAVGKGRPSGLALAACPRAGH